MSQYAKLDFIKLLNNLIKWRNHKILHCLDIEPNISINAIQTYYMSEEVIFYPGAILQFGANLHHFFIWTTPMIEMKWCQQCNFSTQNLFTYREKKTTFINISKKQLIQLYKLSNQSIHRIVFCSINVTFLYINVMYALWVPREFLIPRTLVKRIHQMHCQIRIPRLGHETWHHNQSHYTTQGRSVDVLTW